MKRNSDGYETGIMHDDIKDLFEKRIKEGYLELALAEQTISPEEENKQLSGIMVFFHPKNKFAINEVMRFANGLYAQVPLIDVEFESEKEFLEYIKQNNLGIGKREDIEPNYKNLL